MKSQETAWWTKTGRAHPFLRIVPRTIGVPPLVCFPPCILVWRIGGAFYALLFSITGCLVLYWCMCNSDCENYTHCVIIKTRGLGFLLCWHSITAIHSREKKLAEGRFIAAARSHYWSFLLLWGCDAAHQSLRGCFGKPHLMARMQTEAQTDKPPSHDGSMTSYWALSPKDSTNGSSMETDYLVEQLTSKPSYHFLDMYNAFVLGLSSRYL